MTASVRARVVDAAPAVSAEGELQSLSYAVSHDLSASVRHLTSFSHLMTSELGVELTERQLMFADQIRQAGERCSAMLEQLLVYSRVQSRELVKQWGDPTAAVRLAALRLSGAGERAEITVAPLGEVYADPDLLAQAATTLLDNAVKFRRPDVAPLVVVEPAHGDGFWRMRVTDNGIGVEPRLREAAFVMFRRLNSAEAYPGVGAGLAICRRIARRHGGEASFLDCSEGACLELALPQTGPSRRRLIRTSS